MSRANDNGQVAVLLSGPTERLVLDTLALLSQDYPCLHGPGFELAVSKVAAKLPAGATPSVLSQFAVLLSECKAAGRLPRIRQGRSKSASRDEVFLVSLLAAAQQGDKGRTIEAAIAMLDTGHVHGVIAAAGSLARRLAEHGLWLPRIGSATFAYVAGYPRVEKFLSIAPTSDAAVPKRPTLYVLQSA